MSSSFHLSKQLLIIFVLHFLILIKASSCNSLVKVLPGFSGNFLSKHYSGYVSIDEHNAEHMFYYYVESEGNPSKDPVVLWLNGGPGCSSLKGFISENGPFKLKASGTINSTDLPTLDINPYSWSKVSNIIYLDSPVGTGFSFSRNSSDYKTGDLKTASNTHKFLLKWFKMFPERIHNPFFIAGESYAGIFIPTLASNIIKGIDSGLRPYINLEGYMIGNGVSGDYYIDGNAPVHFAHGMSLISDQLYQDIVDTCHGSYNTPSSNKCELMMNQFDDVTQDVNPYNILDRCTLFYYDKDKGYQCFDCFDNMMLPRSFGKSQFKQMRRTSMDHRFTSTTDLSTDCHEAIAPDLWLNSDIVRQAIHAAEIREIGRWEMCTNRLKYHQDVGSMIKYHKWLISKGLRVLIYSGDHDMVVPHTGSEAWTRSLGYEITDKWRAWISNAQVAGFTQEYRNNLTFLTVKGAGHMVPEDKPREALDFYSRWLAGKKI